MIPGASSGMIFWIHIFMQGDGWLVMIPAMTKIVGENTNIGENIREDSCLRRNDDHRL